jgi:hypothetical protein
MLYRYPAQPLKILPVINRIQIGCFLRRWQCRRKSRICESCAMRELILKLAIPDYSS